MEEKINSFLSQYILKRPYLAFRVVDSFVKKERVYGIVKRLHFLLMNIEIERNRRGIEFKDMRVLDIGCGTGVNISIPIANAGYSVTGIDVDARSIEYANKLSKEYDLKNIKFYCMTPKQLNLPEPFHIVICSEVLEHLAKPYLLIKQIYKLIDNEGLVLVTIPNGYGYYEFETKLWRRYPYLTKYASRISNLLDQIYRIIKNKKEIEHQNITEDQIKEVFHSSTLSNDSFHKQFFSFRRLRLLFEQENFQMVAFSNNTFLAGNIIESLLGNKNKFLKFNNWIADYLPTWLCSGWLFSFRKNPELKNTSLYKEIR